LEFSVHDLQWCPSFQGPYIDPAPLSPSPVDS